MDPNLLKQRLSSGELVLGTGLSAPDARVAVATCQAGIDFLWIDTEHAAFATESVELLPVLARQNGVAPVIRVAWNDPALIKKAYDIGAVGVMVPQVDTAEAAARAVSLRLLPAQGQAWRRPELAVRRGNRP